MKPALLIMAAGLGSRFGGDKQIESVGPDGEALFEYAVFDARRAGFGRIVFVIREALALAFEAVVARLPRDLDVVVVTQRPDDVPAWFAPPPRQKPWGTTHAVLAARDVIDTPFAVVNADDFYGAGAYVAAARASIEARDGTSAIVGLRLDRTLSAHGSVARAIPRVASDGMLTWLDEVRDIQHVGDAISGQVAGHRRALTGAEIASMNCWVFPSSIMNELMTEFGTFLRAHGSDARAECPLPEAVNDLVQQSRAHVRVIEAPGPWFGMTHAADREAVRAGLRRLADDGFYPAPLWSGDLTS